MVCSSIGTKLALDSHPAHLTASCSLSLCSQLVCGTAQGSTPANVCEQLSTAKRGCSCIRGGKRASGLVCCAGGQQSCSPHWSCTQPTLVLSFIPPICCHTAHLPLCPPRHHKQLVFHLAASLSSSATSQSVLPPAAHLLPSCASALYHSVAGQHSSLFVAKL